MASKALGILLSIPRIRVLRVKELLMSGWIHLTFFPEELAFRSFFASLSVVIPGPVWSNRKHQVLGKQQVI